jgi:hypothetical protein
MMGQAASARITEVRPARGVDRGEGLPAPRSPPGTMPAGAEWKIRRTRTPADLPSLKI